VAIKARIEAEADFDRTIKDNLVELFKRIRDLSHETDEIRYPFLAVIETISRMLNLRQREDEDLIAYTTRFKTQRDIMREQIGTEFLDKFIESSQEYKDLMGRPVAQVELKAIGQSKFWGVLLLRNSDCNKYGSLLTTLVSQYSMTMDQYPKSLAKAVKVLELHKFDQAYHDHKGKKPGPGTKIRGGKVTGDQDPTKTEKSLIQKKGDKQGFVCYCCGSKTQNARSMEKSIKMNGGIVRHLRLIIRNNQTKLIAMTRKTKKNKTIPRMYLGEEVFKVAKYLRFKLQQF
jgi:hypothetical protein